MSAELQDLYQEIILDHSRSPRNCGRLAGASGEAHGDNPLCGDRITVQVKVENGHVSEVGFDARGCAISIASASMMTEALKGKGVEEALGISEKFVSGLTSRTEDGPEDLGELAALRGVRKFPTRIKCATLAWHAFDAALHGKGEHVTTE